jgi:hypothetical protein
MISVFDFGYAILDDADVLWDLLPLTIGNNKHRGSHLIECLYEALLGDVMNA